MRTILGVSMMLALGMLLASALSGTLHVPAVSHIARLMPERVDVSSFGLGIVTGIVLGKLAGVSWRNLPQTLTGWLRTNGNSFRLVGWGAAFVAVLYIY